jgi:hypothetical protein
MISFKEYINLLENPGTNGGLEPPLQRPDLIIAKYRGPITGNISGEKEKPPCSKKLSLKKIKDLIFSNL